MSILSILGRKSNPAVDSLLDELAAMPDVSVFETKAEKKAFDVLQVGRHRVPVITQIVADQKIVVDYWYVGLHRPGPFDRVAFYSSAV